eukprot:7731427-Prorocentrum_lima.AAC.1
MTCKRQIDNSDVVIATINKEADCHGTLMEIGYAHGRGIPVLVMFDPEMSEEARREFWFAAQMSQSRPLPYHHRYIFRHVKELSPFLDYKQYRNYIKSLLKYRCDSPAPLE